jgi:hypothetical protein
MHMRAHGEHIYSQDQLSAFAKTQMRFEDACYQQFGVPYGYVPPDGTPVRQAGKVTAALSIALAIAGRGFRVLYVLVAVPLIIIFVVGSVWAMSSRGPW